MPVQFGKRQPPRQTLIGMTWGSRGSLGRIALPEKCLGLEGISKAEGASGFLQSQRSPFDVSWENLNVCL